MAESSAPMPAPQPPLPQQTVKVEFDSLTFALRVSPAALVLVPGSRILWEFAQLPAGFFPWIHFDSADRRTFGPFPAISQLSESLLGEVPTGARDGVFTYRLLLRSRAGGNARQGHATIWSAEQSLSVAAESAKATATPMVQVTANGSALEVAPAVVMLTSASDLLLGFTFAHDILEDGAEGLLEPRIEFTAFTPHGERHRESSPALGPFSALIYDGNTLWGSGDSGHRGIYNYRALALRQSTGEVVWASSPDPVIDDQREPPP